MVQFDNTTTRQFVRVTMNPSQSAAGAWEFTLIVVVVLLAISFVTSGRFWKENAQGGWRG
ncbi:hypothetical protein BC936DRAFT_143910 [Jimgerdemannia flammicorona]|nr:hypothetical protein BC936DRAFT_143910 [Jimgerdemannia flammicorona]